MRILIIIGISFLFCSGCKKNDSVASFENENSEFVIDSLIAESKNFYKKSADTLPVFDSILKKAYNLAKANDRQFKIGEIYNVLAKRHRGNTAYNKAITYHQQAVAIAEQINSDVLHARSIHELAVIFRRMNDNAQALRLYVESLEWAEAVNDTFLIHCSLNGIGNVYYNYADFEKAIEYYRKSLDFLGTKPRNFLGEAINSNTLGESWLFLGNTDSAMYYLNHSLDINKKINSKLGEAICYNGIAMVYLKKEEYEKAISYLNKALVLDNYISEDYRTMFLNNLGDAYIRIKEYKKAEHALKESFIVASELSIKREAYDATKFLSKLFLETNNLKKALFYKDIGIAYKDSLNEGLVKQNSEAMNTFYKSERQEREIVILKQNAELNALKLARQRNMVIAFFGFLVIVSGIGIVAFRQRKLKNQINQVELEQKLFRSQMNPHFVFNSLSAMQTFIMNNDKMEAADYLANFSRLMRNILMSSRTETIILDTEIEILHDYLKLQQLRFSNKFEFDIYVNNEIETEYCFIPPMLIQPFVENAIEHGLINSKQKGRIQISINRQEDSLVILVEDNGVGIIDKAKKEDNDKHESLATKITIERLKNYERITKKSCRLNIVNKAEINKGTGVLVEIKIPYKEN